MSDQPSKREQARQQRQGAALRENLKRRKAQAKARGTMGSATDVREPSETDALNDTTRGRDSEPARK